MSLPKWLHFPGEESLLIERAEDEEAYKAIGWSETRELPTVDELVEEAPELPAEEAGE